MAASGVDAILNAGVRAFVVTAVGLRREDMAQLLLRAMPKVHLICQQRGPFIFNITASGVVSQISNRTLRRRARSKGKHGFVSRLTSGRPKSH